MDDNREYQIHPTAVQHAVATERERCAQIAQKYIDLTNADIAHAILRDIREAE